MAIYTVSAEEISSADTVIRETADYLYETVSNPEISSVGGEWTILGLARSGVDIPGEYFDKYYENAEKTVISKNGVLHEKKYTEYARVAIALCAIGKNPQDTAGCNLLEPLYDFEKTSAQGINGAAWALTAIGCAEGDMAVRQKYIDFLIAKQCSDGGWALFGDSSDADVTAMVLTALSRYRNEERVEEAAEKAISFISEIQLENGGFATGGEETAESAAQVLTAISELGISAQDSRFVKNGNSIIDNIMSYRAEKGFGHVHGDTAPNLMATEQCLYALVAAERFADGKSGLFDMSDTVSGEVSKTDVLSGKHEAVKKTAVVLSGKTFADIQGHKNQKEIEELAARMVINGKDENSFEPNSTMTRAEFASVITRGLGLSGINSAVFSDVTENDWFFETVNTAYSYGIVNGISDTEFNPVGTITREEAAVMIARSAVLCGMNTEMNESAIRNTLSEFSDYTTVSDWAAGSMAFCCREGILSSDVFEICPSEAITRSEVAYMLYNMLNSARLL